MPIWSNPPPVYQILAPLSYSTTLSPASVPFSCSNPSPTIQTILINRKPLICPVPMPSDLAYSTLHSMKELSVLVVMAFSSPTCNNLLNWQQLGFIPTTPWKCLLRTCMISIQLSPMVHSQSWFPQSISTRSTSHSWSPSSWPLGHHSLASLTTSVSFAGPSHVPNHCTLKWPWDHLVFGSLLNLHSFSKHRWLSNF